MLVPFDWFFRNKCVIQVFFNSKEDLTYRSKLMKNISEGNHFVKIVYSKIRNFKVSVFSTCVFQRETDLIHQLQMNIRSRFQ